VSEVAELTKALKARTRDHCLDLRNTDKWCVMTSVGNVMAVVGGTVADTPEESLRIAIWKWDHRSPGMDFVDGYILPESRDAWRIRES